jgi:hypothetical protein
LCHCSWNEKTTHVLLPASLLSLGHLSWMNRVGETRSPWRSPFACQKHCIKLPLTRTFVLTIEKSQKTCNPLRAKTLMILRVPPRRPLQPLLALSMSWP